MEKTYKILKLLIVVLAFIAVLLGAYTLYNRLGAEYGDPTLATQPTEQTRMTAPDFTVYDLEGNAHKLSDFRGKPVVLNFWASWCGPCQLEMPYFEEEFLNHGEEVHFVVVNLTDGSQETVEKASNFIEGKGYTFPVYYDTDLDAAITYGVSSIPATYFIDGEGGLVTYRQGMVTSEMLASGVDLLLEG